MSKINTLYEKIVQERVNKSQFEKIARQLGYSGASDFQSWFEGGDNDWIALGEQLKEDMNFPRNKILQVFQYINTTFWDDQFSHSELNRYLP